MTVIFHIDNILLSHCRAHIVTSFIKKFDEEYRKLDPLTVTCREFYEYLGMMLDFESMLLAYIIT